MHQQYRGFTHGPGNPWMSTSRYPSAAVNPQWEIVHGKVVSSINSADVFRGNGILEISVVDASLMDAPSTLLGRQRIPLQIG